MGSCDDCLWIVGGVVRWCFNGNVAVFFFASAQLRQEIGFPVLRLSECTSLRVHNYLTIRVLCMCTIIHVATVMNSLTVFTASTADRPRPVRTIVGDLQVIAPSHIFMQAIQEAEIFQQYIEAQVKMGAGDTADI